MKRHSIFAVVLLGCIVLAVWSLWPPPILPDHLETEFATTPKTSILTLPSTRSISAPLPPAPALTADTGKIIEPAPETAPSAEHPPGLRFVSGPTNGSDLVLKGMKNAVHLPAGAPSIGDVSALEAKPLPIYILPLAKIANGEGLENAQPAGFQYLIEESGALVLTEEVQVDESGIATRIGRKGGSLAALGGSSIINALNQLQNLEQIQAGSYEVRLLRTGPGGVNLMTLWLKSDANGADLIYALPAPNPKQPLPGGLQAGKLYTGDEFLNLFRPYLQKLYQYVERQGRQATQ